MAEKDEGMKIFYEAHTKAFKKYSLPLSGNLANDRLSDKYIETMMAILSGNLKTSLVASGNLSNENRILLWLCIRFGEIYDSMEYLRDAIVYIQNFPYENTRVTKVRYFRYIVENFLREVYLLDQRLKNFAAQVAEEYEQYSKNRLKKSEAHRVYNKARRNLEKLINARNILVHSSRDFDDQLYKLTQLEQRVNVTFINTEFQNIFNTLLEKEYSHALDKRFEEMNQTVHDIEMIVNIYFIGINSIILNNDGEIYFPKNNRISNY